MAGTPLAEAFVRVRADTSSFRDDVRRGFDAADADGHGRRAGRDAGSGFSAGFSSALGGLASVTRSVLDLLGTAVKWGALAGGISAVGAAAAASAGWVVELAAAVAPLSGLLAGLPGIAVTGAAAFGVWKLATSGLMESISAALAYNDEALAQASAKLSESGQKFIQEFLLIRGQFSQFKDEAQGAFLEPINGQLQRWIDSAQRLQPALAGLAGEFGQMVRIALDFATSSRGIEQLNTILGGTRDLMAALRGALEPLLRGFTDLGVVGNQWLASFAPALQSSLTTFGQWMSEISRSGQALAWLNEATVVLQQLGRLVKDVWQIFTGLLKAAEQAGASALGVLGQLVGAMNKWVNSARGQEILVTIFKALHQIGEATIPVITALAGAVALIAPQIAKIAETALPILAQAIDALGPAIAAIGPGIIALVQGIGTAVQAVAPALQPLGQTISAIFTTLQPLIAAIGPAVAALLPGVQTFFLAAAQGAAALAPALVPIGSAFGAIMTALSPLLPLVGQLAAMIATTLASGVQQVLPSLQLLVKAFGEALTALAPVVPLLIQLAASLINSLVPALAPLLPQIATLVTQLVSGLVPALTPLIPIIGQVAGVIGQMLVSTLAVLVERVLQLLPPLSQAAVIIGQALLTAVTQLAPYIPQLVNAFLSFLPALVNLLPSLTQLAVALLPQFLDSVMDIVPLLPDLITAVIGLNQAMLPLIPVVADLLRQLAPYIPTFLQLAAVIAKDLIPPLTNFLTTVTTTVGGVISKFLELYNRLVGHSIIPDLINGIASWVSRLPGMFAEWVGQAKDWAIRKFEEMVGWITGLPGRIQGALGNMGGLLGGAGHDLIIGFWNGMVGMWDWLRTSIYNFFSGIMPQWVKDALGIASPSKLFAAIGKQLPPGLVVGMDAGQPMLEAASQRMADATVAAFPADAQVSAAPAFSGSFGAPVGGAAGTAGARVVNVENIILQGVFDPTSPVSYRRTVERLREAIIELEQEGYANV